MILAGNSKVATRKGTATAVGSSMEQSRADSEGHQASRKSKREIAQRNPAFDGKINPRKCIAGYEMAMFLAGGDATTLAKSLILAVEDVTHDW